MKSICICAALLLTLALTSVSGRTSAEWWQFPKYNSTAELLLAAVNEPQLTKISTLLAAVKAANLTIPDNTTSTLFAPTNAAFESPDLKAVTGLTAAQFLEPANKEALVKLLSYHVLPAMAVNHFPHSPSDQEGVETALANETVDLESGGRWGPFRVRDATGKDARVTGPPYNVEAGKTFIHFMDKVLIPTALIKA